LDARRRRAGAADPGVTPGQVEGGQAAPGGRAVDRVPRQRGL
jgi:hypothetical protein